MKKKILINIVIVGILLLPLVVSAFDPLVPPCRNVTENGVTQCVWRFNEFMELLNRAINFIIFGLSVPIMAIMFAYAGLMLITAQGGEKKSEAKEIFLNTVIGFAIVCAAWLIIHTILTILGYPSSWIG